MTHNIWWMKVRRSRCKKQVPTTITVIVVVLAVHVHVRIAGYWTAIGRMDCRMDDMLSNLGRRTYLCDLLDVPDRLDTLLGLTKRGGLGGGRVETGTSGDGDGSSRVEGRHGGTGSTRKHRHF